MKGRSLLQLALCACLCLLTCGDGARQATPPEGGGGHPIDGDELDRLRALGYVDVVEEHDQAAALGVIHRDPERIAEGLLYFTNAFGCSSKLIRSDGVVLRSWSHRPCYRWANTVLLPEGDLLIIHRYPADLESATAVSRSFELIRMDWDGEILWQRRLPVHHDIDVTPENRIAALTYHHRIVEDVHPSIPVRDDTITLLNARGETLEEASLTDLLRSSPDLFRLQRVRPSEKYGLREIDLLHSNAIEWMRDPDLAARDPIYAPSNVLITLRHQDAVVIIDWQQKKPVWAWGQGELSGPHDGTLLRSGNVLVFDNGLGRGWSRVVEVDPIAGKIIWEYRAPDPSSFFTGTRGAAQRLENGDTLITNSKWGRTFEVTAEGEVVWDFRNPNTDPAGRPSAIVRTRRLTATAIDAPPFPRSD